MRTLIRRTLSVTLVIITTICCFNAQADCIYNGVIYPEGTILGSLVCAGGQWIRR